MLNYFMLGLALSTPTSVEILDNNVQSEIVGDNQLVSNVISPGDYSDTAVIIDNAYYFENLHHYHGANTNQTCGIIATQILLGYYDTFYNDNIVDEWYDVNISQQFKYCNDFTQSPGTDDPNSEYPKKYHNYLADISYSLGDNPIGGMNIDSVKNLMLNQLNINNVDYDYIYLKNLLATSSLRSSLMNAIDAGRPVMVAGQEHVVVAFGYDENYVYNHVGEGYLVRTPWGVFLDSNDGSRMLLDIIINDDHTHSNNYYSTTLNKYLCPCSCVSYNEEGTYTLEYDDVASTYRIKFTAAAKIYVSVYTDADYDTSFYDIECDVEYDYYDDIEGISDSEYDYNAHITVWEIEEGGTLEFSLDGYTGAIVTLQINTI